MTPKETFMYEIEKLVRKHRISYIDAIVNLCKKRNVEIETIYKFITPELKQKIEKESLKLKLLKE